MSKRTTIRIPDDVYSQLSERAQAEQRTVSNLVILLLKQSLENKMNVATNVADAGNRAETPQHNA
jgi:predicted CopG family antitoxin